MKTVTTQVVLALLFTGVAPIRELRLRSTAQTPATGVMEQLDGREYLSGKVAADGSFGIRGMSGSYQLVVSADRPPGMEVRRIVASGVTLGAKDAVTLVSGTLDVALFVGPREPPKPAIDGSLSTTALVERFKAETTDFRQFEIAEAIVERGDMSVLPGLETFLTHDRRRARGNAAFVFAKLAIRADSRRLLRSSPTGRIAPSSRVRRAGTGTSRHRFDRIATTPRICWAICATRAGRPS